MVWLPKENQLRELLGEYFLSLDSSAGGFVVTVSGPGKAYHTDAELDAADAYARAALYVLGLSNRALSAEHGGQAGGVGTDQHRWCVRECVPPTPCESQQTHQPAGDGAEQQVHHSNVHGSAAAAAPSNGANRTSPKPKPPRESSHTSR